MWHGLNHVFRRRRHAARDIPGPDQPLETGLTLQIDDETGKLRSHIMTKHSTIVRIEGTDAFLQMFMETLTFAVLDQQETEAAEQEMARLERLQVLRAHKRSRDIAHRASGN